MKSNLVTRFATFIALALTFGLFAGCASTPSADWNSRVGNYTYDQAVAELGPPDKQTKFDDGKTTAQWITHGKTDTGFGVGTGVSSGPAGVGAAASPGVGASHPDLILTLTFQTNNVLSAWSRNY